MPTSAIVTTVPANPTTATTLTPPAIDGCTVHQNKAIAGSADGPVGSGAAGGWSLSQCTTKCRQSNACGVAVFSADTTEYTPAGYCELWSSSKGAADLDAYQGFTSYVCSSSQPTIAGATTTVAPPVQCTNALKAALAEIAAQSAEIAALKDELETARTCSDRGRRPMV